MVSREIQPVNELIGFAAVVGAVALLGTSSTVLAQSAASPKQAGSDPGWNVSVYPILAYIPVMGIDVRLPDAPPCTGCPPSTPPESRANSGLSGAAFVGSGSRRGDSPWKDSSTTPASKRRRRLHSWTSI
jgi:hypothetical protein